MVNPGWVDIGETLKAVMVQVPLLKKEIKPFEVGFNVSTNSPGAVREVPLLPGDWACTDPLLIAVHIHEI